MCVDNLRGYRELVTRAHPENMSRSGWDLVWALVAKRRDFSREGRSHPLGEPKAAAEHAFKEPYLDRGTLFAKGLEPREGYWVRRRLDTSGTVM